MSMEIHFSEKLGGQYDWLGIRKQWRLFKETHRHAVRPVTSDSKEVPDIGKLGRGGGKLNTWWFISAVVCWGEVPRGGWQGP